MTATSFAGTKLLVRDAEALERFYADALGFKRVHRLDEGEGDHAFIEIIMALGDQPGVTQLTLMQYLNRPAPMAGEAVIVLTTSDVDASVAAVQAAGGAVTVPVMAVPEYQLRLAYITDPEGHTVELLQFAAA